MYSLLFYFIYHYVCFSKAYKRPAHFKISLNYSSLLHLYSKIWIQALKAKTPPRIITTILLLKLSTKSSIIVFQRLPTNPNHLQVQQESPGYQFVSNCINYSHTNSQNYIIRKCLHFMKYLLNVLLNFGLFQVGARCLYLMIGIELLMSS